MILTAPKVRIKNHLLHSKKDKLLDVVQAASLFGADGTGTAVTANGRYMV